MVSTLTMGNTVAKRKTASRFHAELVAMTMFFGLPTPKRSETVSNWTVKELEKFTCDELSDLNHELNHWANSKEVSGKERTKYLAVIQRVAKVKLKRSERVKLESFGTHRLRVLEG